MKLEDVTSKPAGPRGAAPTNVRLQDPVDIFGDPWRAAEPIASPAPTRPGRVNFLNLFRRPISSRAA